jgi:hypothetical protein
MRGSRPGHLPPPSQSQQVGRVCAAEGCTTTLSVYNEGPTCWQHTDLNFPALRGKRLRDRRRR